MTPAGRPSVGAPINVRLGDDLLAEVDAYAAAEDIKRAEAIRRLVQRGLRRAKQHAKECNGARPNPPQPR
ncbi:ribbon-helix-helix domain-containing protein [Mycolicibacterium goodii]|uniref:CopG family ribbon-helix-helix protein n=1 Tax=Mycolicibacterium goodii TaxID=134601 RepID=UPI001BDD527C|nr:ribbon-helix-helix domain-containing protein [Mycolicibacterium goodii]